MAKEQTADKNYGYSESSQRPKTCIGQTDLSRGESGLTVLKKRIYSVFLFYPPPPPPLFFTPPVTIYMLLLNSLLLCKKKHMHPGRKRYKPTKHPNFVLTNTHFFVWPLLTSKALRSSRNKRRLSAKKYNSAALTVFSE